MDVIWPTELGRQGYGHRSADRRLRSSRIRALDRQHLSSSLALAIKAWGVREFWAQIGQTAASYPELTVDAALHNIFVATIGNLVGGSLMVGGV
jgi:hypothetical protein